MLSEIRHYPVNWVDGMKISKRNFVEFENFVNEFLRDATAQRITDNNFGLLPVYGSLKSHELYVHIDSQDVISIKLTGIRAITAAGARMEMTGDAPVAVRIPLAKLMEIYGLNPAEEHQFYTTVSVNYNVRVPFGETLTEEVPPRYPYTRPQYRLSVIPRALLNSSEYSSAHLIIGKLAYKNNELRVVENYIPPCTSIRSFPLLQDQFTAFENLMIQLENFSIRIIQKIKLKPEKKSRLSDNIYALIDKLQYTLANEMTGYRLILADQPPVYMINVFAKLAKIFRSFINSQTSFDKEELLTYFSMWAEVQPLVIEEGLDVLIYVDYNHNEIGEALGKAQFIWQLMLNLLNKLSQLEYIGERRGKQIFVIENPVHQENKPIEPVRSKFNPLD